jgi:hypothetical protein
MTVDSSDLVRTRQQLRQGVFVPVCDASGARPLHCFQAREHFGAGLAITAAHFQ